MAPIAPYNDKYPFDRRTDLTLVMNELDLPHYTKAAAQFGLSIEVLAKSGEQYLTSHGFRATVSEGKLHIKILGSGQMGDLHQFLDTVRALGAE